MSKVVQHALQRALNIKGVELVEDVRGYAYRFGNEGDEGDNRLGTAGTRVQEFILGVKSAVAAYERARAELEAAMQRDRDAGT